MTGLVLAENAMDKVPPNLRDDLLKRMDYLLRGICGDIRKANMPVSKDARLKV